MVTNHLHHTLQNLSCLQVFLYTDINLLIQEALRAFSQITVQSPKIVIVPTPSMSQKLEEALCQQQGASGFIQIGTLKETIRARLLKIPGFNRYQVFDEISLSLALFELMQEKQASMLPFMEGCPQNDNFSSHQMWASKLAAELLALESAEEFSKVDGALRLRDELLKRAPFFQLPYEAFDLLEADFDQMLWVGFEQIGIPILKKLKNRTAQIYSLVPTAIFMGDVLTPKQRLKELLKQAEIVELAVEHPILARFTKALAPFYNALIDLDIDYTVITHDPKENLSSLEEFQNGLLEGIFTRKLERDGSLKIESFASPYLECQWVIGELQKLYQLDSTRNMDKIAFVSPTPDLYVSILNGIGQTLEKPLAFSPLTHHLPLKQWFAMLFFPTTGGRDGSYFSEWLLLGCQFLSAPNEDYKALCDLMNRGHFYTMSPLEGSVYLKRLKEQFLKTWFFDLGINELPFEVGLFETAPDDERLERTLVFLNPLIDWIESIERLEKQTLSWGNWIQEFLVFVQNPFIDLLGVKTALAEWVHSLFEYRHFKVPLSGADFLNLALGLLKDFEKDSSAIKVLPLSARADSKVDFCFFIGMQPDSEIEAPSLFFERSVSPQNKKRLGWPLWIQRVTKGLYLSYNKGFLNKYDEGLHLWVESLQRCLTENYRKPLGLEEPIIPAVKKEFLAGVQEEFPAIERRPCSLEIRYLRKFLKNEESFIKSYFLKVHKPGVKLDAALFDFSLLQWKARSQGQVATRGLLSFAKPVEEEVEDYFFRSKFAYTQDKLEGLHIQPSLILELDDKRFEFAGLSSEAFERKLLKKKEALLKLHALTQFFG